MNSFLHLNIDGIFGRAEKPEGERSIRRSNAVVAILLVLAGIILAAGFIALAVSDPDAHIAGWFCLGSAAVLALCSPLAASPRMTLVPEGLRIKRMGSEEEYSWADISWFETQGVDKVTIHTKDRKYEYYGKDWQLLIGAMRAADVRGFDPDDEVPGGLGVKRVAGAKTSAVALLIVSVLFWAEFLIPGIPEEAVIMLSIFFGILSLTFITIAVCLLRQKVELFEDGFYLTKAIGPKKYFRYDEIAGRTVKKQMAGQYGGELYNVTLYSSDGRKAVVQHALLCPELLELAGFDGLPFKDGAK